jgi:hypothetical protein
VLVADDADAMAESVCRLYEDEALWERLSQAGMENVRRFFSFEAAADTVRRLLERVDHGASQGGSARKQTSPPESPSPKQDRAA